jgi:predicted RNase H-like nuclease (RuvC/YqgF family)
MTFDLMSCDSEIHKLEQEIKNLKSSIETLKQQHVHEIDSLCTEKDMVVKTFETKISDIHDNFGKKKIVLIESHQAEIDSLNSEYLSSKDHFKRIEQELRNRLKNETQSYLGMLFFDLIKSCPSPQQELHIVTGTSFPVLVLDYCSLVSVPG